MGRRNVDFPFDRVFIPSLVIDHTELVLRQAGTSGREGFVVWAGALSGGDAHVYTLVVPRTSSAGCHGEISQEVTASLLEGLDARDLVPVAQLHSHPESAFLSETDAIRPLVVVPGFLSIVIPNFGFIDLENLSLWSAHEFQGGSGWHELGDPEKARRLVIDDSLIRIE